MRAEANMIANLLNLNRNESGKVSYIKYSNKDNSIVMLTPGDDKEFLFNDQPLSRVGKVSAGIITTILIEEYNPKIIINCGTAGGIGAGVSIGDIIVGEYITNHDMRFPFPSYTQWATRKIPLKYLHKLKFLKLPYKIGIITSAESFTTSDEEWKIIDRSKAIAKDMEAAGVMQALEILNYTDPCYVIKSITDITSKQINKETSSEMFINNFTLAMNKLSEFIKEIVNNKQKLL
jgi:adenosylhomocysteine nucleosidase